MSTQSDSLAKLQQYGRAETVDAAVLANITALGPICRDALGKATGLLTSTLCGAVDRLKKRGLIAVHTERVLNVSTQRNVQAYYAVQTAQPENHDATE